MSIIKFAFKRVTSPVACCALSTKVGTRDEEPNVGGLAHLNEHMLFKGTKKRGSTGINNLLENVGGELNAYTTKEETVIHATVLKEDLRKAIDLLFELAFTSIYPEKELVKEKEVVYEEIISYKDSPSESIYEDFEALLFEGHPLQYQILGSKRTLDRITADTLKDYLSRYFIPQNMAISIVADISEKEVVKMVNSCLWHYRSGVECSPNFNVEQAEYPDILIESNFIGKPFYKEIRKKNHQAHCVIGATAYSFYEERKRLALAMVANILGGPATNARLNMVLREKHALVYSVEAAYSPYSDTGAFTIYFGCDKPLINKCIDFVHKETDRMIEVKLTEREIANAKKQLLGQLAIASDNSEAQCLSMGKSLMVYGNVEPLEVTMAKIEELTADDLQNVAAEILPWKNLSVLIYR
jgi:predicted Zn-dependent peptidase